MVYFDDILKRTGCNINESIVYSGGDLFVPFGIYLCLKQKEFTIVEISPNQIHSKDRVGATFRLGMSSKAYSKVQDRSGAIDGSSRYVNELILYPASQENPDVINKMITKTDYPRLLPSIPDSKKKYIKECFADEIAPGSQVVLLNSSGNTMFRAGINRDKLPCFYQTLVDYFCTPGREIVLKGHPEDPTDISRYIEGSKTMSNAPIELIAFSNDSKIARVVSIDTTAGIRLMDMGLADENIRVGHEFYTEFNKLDLLHYVCTIANEFDARLIQTIVSDNLFIVFLHCNFPDLQSEMSTSNRTIIEATNSNIKIKTTADESYKYSASIKLTSESIDGTMNVLDISVQSTSLEILKKIEGTQYTHALNKSKTTVSTTLLNLTDESIS